MTTAGKTSAAEAAAIWVHRLDDRLAALAQLRLDPRGVLAGPVHVSPAGEIVSLVVGTRGAPALAKWDARGEPVLRRALDVAGTILTSRLTSDGALVVVTDASIVRVNVTDGRVIARRSLGFASTGALVQAARAGAWFAFPHRLVYASLDGHDVEKPLPVGVDEAPGDSPPSILATEGGDCLVAELRYTEHPVRGRRKGDITTQLVLSRLSSHGDVLAQASFGEVRTRREWLWQEGGSGDSLLPRDVGIVRTRYEGGAGLEGWGERPDGDVILVMSIGGGARRLTRLDRSLHERWSRSYEHDGDVDISPAWTHGFLVYPRGNLVFAYDEQGLGETTGHVMFPAQVSGADFPRAALGRGASGQWVVVRY